jgi:putative photosynthetic complex assembly protein 2
MFDYLLAVGIALLGWWLSTGIILYLNLLPQGSHRWSMAGMSLLAIASLASLPGVAETSTVLHAAQGFCIALVLWGWLEMSYLMGFLTGSRCAPCPPDSSGWDRFQLALKTSLHHEFAVIGMGSLMIFLTWDSPNQVATGSFVTLWLMRWSAKLNLFLGVPNFNEQWLPPRSRYLASYMQDRPMNLLFPFSVGIATGAATLLLQRAIEGTPGFATVAPMLVCALLMLAILEHWFLVLPVHDSALWQWALSAARRVSERESRDSRRPLGAMKSHTGAAADGV